ncbi:MAG: glycoside hydrolase family 127 protein [Tannerella sp.]|nr:glycoside hydrolase family 127 protein [Tannerella sp.]
MKFFVAATLLVALSGNLSAQEKPSFNGDIPIAGWWEILPEKSTPKCFREPKEAEVTVTFTFYPDIASVEKTPDVTPEAGVKQISCCPELKAEPEPAVRRMMKHPARENTLSTVGNDRQTVLPPGAIRLKGYLENDIQNSIVHWNKGVVPYDEFVRFFRNGTPQFALGEMWGKAVRSGCMFYRYTQDPELKKILDATVKDMLTTQRPNGSISCTPEDKQPGNENGDLWERKYVMLGMEEYYEWVSRDPAVLESLKRQAACIIAQVGHAPKTEITDLGWSAVNIGHEHCHIESSTLLEPFMRLYKWTGERSFLDFAAYIVASGGTKHYNLIEQAYDNVEPHKMSGHYPKAYEMMSLFEGLTEYYRTTGDERCKQAFMNLYNNIRSKEITIIGNAGADQPYHPYVAGEAWGNTAAEQTNPDITRMMETCVGVTWMKFCSQILRLTGDSQPADEIEKYICNGLLGAMKPGGDGFSYVNLLNGAKVNDHGWGWQFDDVHVTCCNLNGPMGLAYIPYIAVTGSETGPVINLYNACNVNMFTPGQTPLQLEMETDYPVTDKVLLKVNPEKAEAFTLSLRIPAWSEQTVVKINGKKHAVVAGKYAAIHRTWKSGDRVEITFDMRCRVINAPHGSNRKGDDMQAVIRGPIVLARDENTDKAFDNPVTLIADKHGFIKIAPVRPTLPSTRMEFSIPTTDGFIRMIDYASVDGWNGAKIRTWLPKKKR